VLALLPIAASLLACSEEPVAEPLETVALAQRVAEQGMARWPAEDLPFDWMQTVWAYGLTHLSQVSGETEGLSYAKAWMAEAVSDFESDGAFTSSDSLSPAGIASTVMSWDPDAGLTPILTAAADYLDTVPRMDNDAVVHWGSENTWGFDDDQVWIDSLFMVGMLMLREAERVGDDAWLDAFAAQYFAFSDLCRDPDTQLYRHAYDGETGENIPTDPVFWARGNSWIVMAGASYLSQTSDHADRDEIEALVVSHAVALSELQADDGLWWTVLDPTSVPDDPSLSSNYTETSASALIAAGMHLAMDAGALDAEIFRPVITAAVDGVLARVQDPDDTPVVTGTSLGTMPGEVESYLAIPTLDDLILGVGAVLFMLAEVDGMERG
jgi:unsaturated rhamnogalacturonyl hydrolase